MTETAPRHRPIGQADPKQILVVDDDSSVREMMARALARAGFHVLQAGSGPEARKVMEETGGGIDLVVMDVVLPGMEGHEAVSLLRVRHPDLKVLYISGYTTPEVRRVEVVRDGREPFLRKPFRVDELLDAVRRETERT